MAIQVVQYDAQWPQAFEHERARLEPRLRPWLVGTLKHVGSTAIAGMPAKPVIDMVGVVRNHEDARNAIPVVAELGYVHWAEDPHRGWRHWLLYPHPEARTHHLYLMEASEPELLALVQLRDHLRAHPAAAAAYAEVKRRSAEQHPQDREAYTRGKTAFLQELFREQGWWLPHPR